jgi:hypothetical protein
MKKLIYTFLAVSIIFSACKKEEGCTDPTATNYNADAEKDDGSCIAVISGCTDQTALNYNSLANTDDGSCIDIILGCMNPIATNYNANATEDDGSCIYGIVGVWTPTSVDIDSSMTTTIAGDIIDVFDFGDGPEILSYSGSQTMTPEEADMEGTMEFTADGYAIFAGEDTSLYTYSNDMLIIIDEDEEMEFACTFTETDLTLTMEESMDTAFTEPMLVMLGFANGDVTVSASQRMTINCSRNTAVNTNVNQRIGNTNHSWFVKPKFNTAKLINSIKQK